MSDLLVRAQELGGRWVSLGSDAARGIVVENLLPDADTWGPRGCSFVLRRRTDVPWPDIGALTPLEVFDQGVPIWSGRVKGTPTSDGSDRSITVNGEGWQYHLDDDVYQRNYVQSKLSAFVDTRSSPIAPLANFIAGGSVVAGDGAIVLTIPGDGVKTYPAGTFVGVTLDFGVSLCTDVAVNWTNSNNASPVVFYCSGSDSFDGAAGDNAFAFAVGTPNPAAAFNTGSFSGPRRYVNLFLNWPLGGTPTADIWVRIIPPTSFFGAAAYVSAGVSILKASDVVLDAKAKGTLLLSSDLSKVQATSFAIPDFAMTSPTTPRDVISAANVFHAWQPRVTVDKLLEYRPLPATPAIQVDQRAIFNEASAGDSSQIYSDALVTYTDAAGQAQVVRRAQPASVRVLSGIQPTNPSAATNTATWTTNATLSRDTTGGEFTTAPAGFKLDISSSGGYATTSSWTGALQAGKTYSLDIDASYGGGGSGGLSVTLEVWVDGVLCGSAVLTGSGSFVTGTCSWVQPSTSAPVVIVRASPFATPPLVFVSTSVLFDNLLLYESAATIVNRRGFRRTKVIDTNMALTAAGAQQIADVFLQGHRTTPLKGQLVVAGYGVASEARSGRKMKASELLLYTGELVRLAHLIDPDTGALGREGRIASVSWDAASDTATIEIDSEVTSFEALVQRLAVLSSVVP